MNRALPVAAALVLTLMSAGAALGVNSAVGSWIAPPEGALSRTVAVGVPGAPRTSAPTAHSPRARSEAEYIHEILVRNIFDAAFIDSYSPKKPGGDSDVEVLTDLRVTLLGTVVADPADYSSALIATEGGERPYGYGIGDRIEDAEIVRIEPKLVHLRRGNGKIEILEMSDETEKPKQRTTTTAAADKPASAGNGIEQVSENSFVVDRSVLEQHLQDLEGLSRLGRALLHRGADGEFDGYRLSAIRRGTVVEQLGIKNGDIIHAVNGQPLTSVQGAMSAYQNLMNESSFSFEITRRGQRITMEYQVR